jgi:hypothetical protein
MNRIILIGNGFDLAHGLKTSYKDFIDNYWTEFRSEIYIDRFPHGRIFPYKGDFVELQIIRKKDELEMPANSGVLIEAHNWDEQNSYIDIQNLINAINPLHDEYLYECTAYLTFKNEFFKRISERTGLENWVDIEQEYYDALKKLLPIKNSQKRKEIVKKLNEEFCAVKKLLEKYLAEGSKKEVESKDSVSNAFKSKIHADEIAVGKRDLVVDSVMCNEPINTHPEHFYPHMVPIARNNMKRDLLKSLSTGIGKLQSFVPKHTSILNFNYTKTAERLYLSDDRNYEVVNIHGELNNDKNPIIFGYGDELDDDYKKIEKLQDNDFLENIKSIQYHKTRNYRELLKFIESEPYQVFVMGHSCGNSDRTLLNTLFEHENCVSLKVFYRQLDDGTDDYSNLIRNISRNFNDKQRMRDVVVDYEKCSPLVPASSIGQP